MGGEVVSRSTLRRSTSLSLGLFAALASAGAAAMAWLANSSPGPTFGQRYGNNPRSTANGGKGRGAAARIQRAAARERNLAARSSKRRPAKLARKVAAKARRAGR